MRVGGVGKAIRVIKTEKGETKLTISGVKIMERSAGKGKVGEKGQQSEEHKVMFLH